MTDRALNRPRPESLLADSPVWDELDGGILVLACSGGADSVALLRAAQALLSDEMFRSRFANVPELRYWHLDHQVRAESHDDARFVEQLGTALGVQGQVDQLEQPELAGAEGNNLEAAMRRARYRALQAYIDALKSEAAGPARALTAHHLGDQAETILHHIIRGTHLAGLAGIHEQRGSIYRPWLWLSPEEIREYLAGLGQDFREDPSNADTALTRNRIRHEVLPELLAINPRAREHIGRLAPTAALASKLVRRRLARLEVEVFTAHDLQRWLPLIGWQEGLYELHRFAQPWEAPDLLALYCARLLKARGQRLTHRDYHQLLDWAADDESAYSRGTFKFRVLSEQLLALEGLPDDPDKMPVLKLNAGQSLRIGGLTVAVQASHPEFWRAEKARPREPWEQLRNWPQALEELSQAPPREPHWHCHLPENVAFPLMLRQALEGERIELAGGGSKLLSDVFIDAKLPRCYRHIWPVLADAQGRALWLPGLADSAAMRFRGDELPRHVVLLRNEAEA